MSPAPLILKWDVVADPVKNTRFWTQALSQREDGGTDYIVQCWNYKYRNIAPADIPEWTVLNLNSGQSDQVRLPGFANSLFGVDTALRAPNGRIFFAASGMHIYVFDPATRKIRLVDQQPDALQGGYKLLYSAIIGADGNFYGATQSDNGKVGAVSVDSRTLATRFFPDLSGKVRTEGLTYGYYISADPPWVYVAEGKGEWTLVALNVATDERRVLAENASWVSFDEKPQAPTVTIQAPLKVGADGKPVPTETGAHVRIADDKQIARYWCVNGRLSPAPPDSAAPVEAGQGRDERFAGVKPMTPPPVHVEVGGPDIDGTCTVTWTKAGEPAPKTVTFHTATAEPIDLESLILLPDGTFFGNAQQYRGFFRYRPDAKDPSGRLESFPQHGPSIPAFAWFDGKVYFSGYPSGHTFVYDPNHPWKVSNEALVPGPQDDNPRSLIHLGGALSGAHHAYFLVPASNDRIYFCGHRERGQTGTGLAWYEPKTQRAFGQNKNLTQLMPRGFEVMQSLNSIVLSGTLEDDPYIKTQKATQAELVIFDMELNEQRRVAVKPGLRNTGWLYPADSPEQVIGCISDDQTTALYRMDLRNDKVLAWVDLRKSDRIAEVFERMEDKTWWAILTDNRLCRLDPKNLNLTTVGVLPGPMAKPVWRKDSIWGTSGPSLVRFDGPFTAGK